MDELKPCPFCGEHRISIRQDPEWADWMAMCENCAANVPSCDTEAEARENWNKRVQA